MRILLLADSHLGFDLPERPRVKRRRRGHDFLANYAKALAPALRGEADIVVHAGDVFDRPHIPTTLAYQALEPLRRIAERGIPVFIVPGNHERSRLPHVRFAAHPNLHVFDRPRTFAVNVAGRRVVLAGFPYERRNVRGRFAELIDRAEWRRTAGDLHLLCLHHCVEGATVGPQNFRFTTADDVIRINDVPDSFAAVLSGHIHRHQVLTTDLRRRPVAVPILYPGSIERTAFAETGEEKGYLLVEVEEKLEWRFQHLPARPMIASAITLDGLTPRQLEQTVRGIIAGAPADAVIGLCCSGTGTASHMRMISAARLRAMAPESMNVEVRLTSITRARTRARARVE
jgi:DNA repair exonuclease SbcCD nuclease subunit